MDANGLNFWMLHAAADWLPQGGADGLHYCSRSGRLQLRSQRMGTAPTEDSAAASALVETAPMCRDSFGNQARWDATSRTVVAAGAGVGDVVIYTPPAGQTVTDLAMGHDGVLYLAVSGTLVLVDRRNRWPNFTLIDATFAFWRLKALPQGGVLALDRAAPQLGVVTGLPLQVEPSDVPNPGILRSCVENGDPPRIVRRHPLPATEKFVAIAAMSPGRFLLLSWAAAAPANTAAFLRIHDARTGLSSAWTFSETKYPYGVAWLGDKRVGILATGLNEALIYDLDGSPATLVAAGDTYILSGRNVDPFVQSFDATPSYAFGGAIHPLLPLSLNSLAASGATTVPKLIDSGAARTTWHRLLLEAVVPPRCGVVVRLAASDSAADFGAGAANPVTWHAHAFGATRPDAKTPLATWLPVASEVPFGKPLLDEPPIADRQGLFMVLVQRSGTAVRDLSGRYLGIRVELAGDRRSTPEIAALRVYASRFSYVTHYLPELYRENKFGPDADKGADTSTRRDFFERFVNIFEAQMTRIEDEVASSYLLTRAESAPEAALDWLGGWIGLDPAGYPPARRRARLGAAPDLHRKRGTVGGIVQAVDVATDGLCSRGAVVVLEAFRLRHIFATILGADLAISNDPLLPGYSGNSNSFVGNTLFVGDPRNPDFLALFASTVALPSQQAEVRQFLDTLAWRILVFIHNQVEAVDANLVRRIVEYEKPAHVVADVQIATQPFMIGLAALVGANSYLASEPPLDPTVVDAGAVGRYSLIRHAPALDPRWENGAVHAG